MNIVKSDERPFLIKILEFGQENGRLQDSFLKEDVLGTGARVIVALAVNLLEITRKENIQKATEWFVGICSLGLIHTSQGDSEKALDILIENGIKYVFRLGWTCIDSVVKEELEALAKTNDLLVGLDIRREKESSLAKLVSADKVHSWSGYGRFLGYQEEISEKLRRVRFSSWIESRYAYQKDRTRGEEPRVETVIISLLVRDTPRIPLTQKEVRLLIRKIKLYPERCRRELEEKTSKFEQTIPSSQRNAFIKAKEEFFEKKLDGFFSDIRGAGKTSKFFAPDIVSFWFSVEEPNAMVAGEE